MRPTLGQGPLRLHPQAKDSFHTDTERLAPGCRLSQAAVHACEAVVPWRVTRPYIQSRQHSAASSLSLGGNRTGFRTQCHSLFQTGFWFSLTNCFFVCWPGILAFLYTYQYLSRYMHIWGITYLQSQNHLQFFRRSDSSNMTSHELEGQGYFSVEN